MQPSPIGESRPCRSFAGEAGLAAALALTALSIFTLLGLFLALNATMEVRLTDNFEARVQAAYAARAGLRHAGELLSGVEFDDLLRGPDGTWDNSPAYTALARSYGFRNPIDWITARRLDIMNPLDILQGQSDDGLVNTGRYEVKNGTVLIPGIGIPLTAPDPYSAGGLTFARYFVKVSDNNGEAPEVAMDSADNPFLDGDGTIIVRSLGISPRIRETAGATAQINAVAVYEARFKRHRTFDLQSALLVQGNEVVPSGSEMFSGNSFLISAGDDNFGLAVVDTAPGDGISPLQQIVSRLLPEQRPNIRGMERIPSVGDVTRRPGNPGERLGGGNPGDRRPLDRRRIFELHGPDSRDGCGGGGYPQADAEPHRRALRSESGREIRGLRNSEVEYRSSSTGPAEQRGGPNVPQTDSSQANKFS